MFTTLLFFHLQASVNGLNDPILNNGAGDQELPPIVVLREALRKRHYSTMCNAIRDLRQSHAELRPAIQLLAPGLKSHDPMGQYMSLAGLAEIGPRARTTLASVLRLTRDSDDRVRERAVKTAGEIGGNNPVVLRALIDHLSDENSDVRCAAARALGNLGPQARAATAALRKALQSSDSSYRVCAATALWQIAKDSNAAFPILNDALKSGEAILHALVGLADMGPAAYPSLPRILPLLNSKWELVRCGAIGVLGSIGPRAAEAIPALEAKLQDPHPCVQMCAIHALMKIRQKQP